MRGLATFLFFILSSPCFCQADLELRFDHAAKHFTGSAPVGNGRLGAMVFGDPVKERIVLNEISMWSGSIQDANKADAWQYLAPIQQLLMDGKNLEAQKMLQEHFVCAGPGTGRGQGAHEKYGCYQTLGDCWIQWADTVAPVSDYSRKLRLDSAISSASWRRGKSSYSEQVIVSGPQQAIIIRLRASTKGSLNFLTGISRKERSAVRVIDGRIQMTGQLDGGEGAAGIRYSAVMRVIPVGGSIGSTDSSFIVRGATECLLIITAGTDMNWPNIEHRGADPLPRAIRQAQVASTVPWGTLLRDHVNDFRTYFNQCRLRLDDRDSARGLLLSERLGAVQNGGEDASLVGLYFNYGRYLLISSSRGSLPANLQGLWAEEYQTPWNGDYHTNINIQMNYWLSDAAGLTGCQPPVFQLLGVMARYGRATAQAYYRAPGWVTHSITNPWGFTAPGEGAEWGSSLTGGAWLATHLLRHYQYYPDRSFLQRYYPILKGASQFFTAILIREPSHHWLVTAPSNSPENSYRLPDGRTASTCMGPTMDMQIARELLTGTADAAAELGVDAVWADSLRKMASQLAPDQISPRTGGIQEWLEDYEEAEPHHRHVSPLYGLYPYDEITPWATPDLAKAARVTLERRGDEGTGWSRAWKIAFWARLGDGNHAYKMLRALWKPAGDDRSGFNFDDAGTYGNLFDACPPFQIDGNFGATAAIMELFVQSQGPGGIIRLLPALPTAAIFQNGRLDGIHARNGFSIDLRWTQGKLAGLTVHSLYGKKCRIACSKACRVRNSHGQIVPVSFSDGILSFQTVRSEKYTFEIIGAG